ncbi:MAG: hypothetical protein RLY86_133 [Pseudomonadota bacterium]|jgi:phage tail protein X
MQAVRSMQGDTVDAMVHRHYGSSDMVAAVLAANPGLSDLGPILPAGTLVRMPAAVRRTITHPVKLWD